MGLVKFSFLIKRFLLNRLRVGFVLTKKFVLKNGFKSYSLKIENLSFDKIFKIFHTVVLQLKMMDNLSFNYQSDGRDFR